jgi:hypothetical protein
MFGTASGIGNWQCFGGYFELLFFYGKFDSLNLSTVVEFFFFARPACNSIVCSVYIGNLRLG